MKKAAVKGLLPGWSAKDILTIKMMTLSSFYGAQAFVRRSHTNNSSEPHPEYHELTSIAVYLHETRGLVNLSEIASSPCLTPSYPPLEVKREWSLIPYGMSQFEPWRTGVGLYNIEPSVACYFYYHRLSYIIKGRVPFEKFGGLGFAFWSLHRMSSFGLIPSVPGTVSDEDCAFIWCSMLDTEALKETVDFSDVIGGYPR